MFLAIVIPAMKSDKKIFFVVILAVVLSCCFKWITFLQKIPVGFSIILCAILASIMGALFFPITSESSGESHAQ